jgi:hypothetical protein
MADPALTRVLALHRIGWTPSRIARDLRMPRDRVAAILETANSWDVLRDEPGTTGDQFVAALKRRGASLEDEWAWDAAEFALAIADRLDETQVSPPVRKQVLFSLTNVVNDLAADGAPDTNPLIAIHLRRALRLLASPELPDESEWPVWLERQAA